MQIDTSTLTGSQIYHIVTQAVVPRPIAWILTENSNGTFNVAPFSYFNALSSEPPLLMVSIGRHSTEREKDTLMNIKRTKELVVHIPSVEHAAQVTQSAASLAYGESELTALGLATTECDYARLPRLTDCKIAFHCSLYEIHELGATPQSIVYAKIESIYVAEGCLTKDEKGRINIAAKAVDPLARLGASQYASLGDVIVQARPK